jgi:LysM repeat protein
VGQVLAIPGTGGPTVPAGYTQYVVKQGDYLVKIARQYNLSWVTLATVNNIVAPWIIYPGQTLLIPATG